MIYKPQKKRKKAALRRHSVSFTESEMGLETSAFCYAIQPAFSLHQLRADPD
jgi:hypothetical protein